MTQEEKNFKLVEILGWKNIKDGELPKGYPQYSHWRPPSGYKQSEREQRESVLPYPPNCFKDLNVIHELENYLLNRGDDWGLYCDNLLDIIVKTYGYQGAEMLIHSSSSQRAEALGKTLKLW